MKQINRFQGSNCFGSEFDNFKEVQELELWNRGAAILTVSSWSSFLSPQLMRPYYLSPELCQEKLSPQFHRSFHFVDILHMLCNALQSGPKDAKAQRFISQKNESFWACSNCRLNLSHSKIQ